MSDIAFGLWLKQRRRALDLTQEQLGERVGYATASIRKFEAGARRPSREIAERLAEALELAPEERASFVRAARLQFGPDVAALQALKPHVQAEAVVQALPDAQRARLPMPASVLVGRASELAELGRLLGDPACRLIGLSGPGGMGKTRLALQAANQYGGQFADGAYFAPLASVGEAEQLASAIASALALPLYGTDDHRDQLLRHLRDKELLLVLDNMEHLLGGVGLLADLLRHAPGLKLLVTSRERLNLQGEWQFELEGLPVPASEHTSQIEESGAVMLFVQQARRARTDFRLGEADQPMVARICRLLEGMPLGIELAAAWVRVLSCAEIAQEIERNLDFLAVSAHDLPARHRSLRAVFSQSWELLDVQERQVLRRLSIFQGGFSRAAAEAVCAELNLHRPADSRFSILNSLASLIDKSLLKRGSDGRYEMHELVCQYAKERLKADPDEYAAANDRHCSYYAAWLQARENALRNANQKEAIQEISAEIDNLRRAGEWAIGHGRLAEIRQSIRSLCWFYEVRGWLREGATQFQRLASALNDTSERAGLAGERAIILGQALAYQGWFCFHLGKIELARSLLRQSIDLLRQHDAPQPLADAVAFFGFLSYVIGDYTDAQQYLEEGLAISQAIGDQWTAVFCQSDLGKVVYQQGEYHRAQQLFGENLAAWRALGDPHGLVCAAAASSAVYIASGQYDEARMLLQEALLTSSGQYDLWSLGNVLDQLGRIAYAQGQYAEADYLLRESIALFREIDDRWHVAQVINALGDARLAVDQVVEARRCFQEALEIALAAHALPIVLEALVGLASIIARDAEPESAARVLAFVIEQPACSAQVRERAVAQKRELAASLPLEYALAAEQAAGALTVETAIELVREPDWVALSLDRHSLLAQCLG